ncbi:MAG: inositol monophosphatase family protein [Pseudomonadota bacterium]
MQDIKKYQRFIEMELMPQALEKLKSFYRAYCDGVDLDIQTKADDSPASRADRETEKFLREKIQEEFPDDGIWGEEFGGYNLDREYIWLLDPLDGTREFLAKKDHHFGCLIGLAYQGKALLGMIGDPLNGRIWTEKDMPSKGNINLEEAVLSCTNSQGMFKTQEEQDFITATMDKVKDTITGLNCIGFANVIDGSVDIAIENDLKLHDIVPLIPPLTKAGALVTDFSGNNYVEKIFDIDTDSKRKFGVIVTPYKNLLEDVLSLHKERKAA